MGLSENLHLGTGSQKFKLATAQTGCSYTVIQSGGIFHLKGWAKISTLKVEKLHPFLRVE
jgi:hypothetical protein